MCSTLSTKHPYFKRTKVFGIEMTDFSKFTYTVSSFPFFFKVQIETFSGLLPGPHHETPLHMVTSGRSGSPPKGNPTPEEGKSEGGKVLLQVPREGMTRWQSVVLLPC